MKLTCQEVAHAALGEPAQRAGRELLWRCPNHDDRHPSLSVNPSKDVWFCGPCDVGGSAWELATFLAKAEPEDKPTVTAWLRERGLLRDEEGGAEAKLVATYDYRDESGRRLFQVVRYHPKTFRQRRPDGNAGWIWNLDGVRRVLYNLPNVLAAEALLIVEGERDVETARGLKLPATTNPGGAGKWRPEYSEQLRGKQVVIIVDGDEPGRKHGREVARALIGIAAAVRLAELPGAKDLSDWVERGGTRERLIGILRAVPDLTAGAFAGWGVDTAAAGATGRAANPWAEIEGLDSFLRDDGSGAEALVS
jgi:putative DNA primase/helicase